jgi:glycogen debranching enzyme
LVNEELPLSSSQKTELSTVFAETGGRQRVTWVNWLYWYALQQHGLQAQAAALRQANLALLSQAQARFGEYFELDNGKQLGSPDQSWTAAVLIDWLSAS